MYLPPSHGRVLPLPVFLSMASKFLRDQQPLVSLLMGPMLSDMFGANVEGRVMGLCCKTYSQICISPYVCILRTMKGCLSARAGFGFILSPLGQTTWLVYKPMSLLSRLLPPRFASAQLQTHTNKNISATSNRSNDVVGVRIV